MIDYKKKACFCSRVDSFNLF